jgi:hypothetical protein
VKDSTVEAVTYTATDTTDSTTITQTAPVTFTAGPATKLVYTTVPSTGTAGTAFSVTVQSQDANGNPASPTSTTTITLSKASGGGTLSGTLTGTISTSGNSVTISTPVYSKSDTMTLKASATVGETGLTAVTSGGIVFSPGAANKLVWGVQPPSSVTRGTAITPAMTVLIEDQNGNLTTSTASVTLTLNISGSDSISSGGTVSAVSGTATFGAVILGGQQSGRTGTLPAASTGLTSATSSSFTVN